MADEPIANFQDLLDRFDALVAAAETVPIEPEVVDYLRQTRTRLLHVRSRSLDGESRVSPRHPETGSGRLVVEDKAVPVTIIDGSEAGFGVLSPVRVDPDTAVRLDLDGDRDTEMFEALVTYCAQKGEHYHLGLDIFSSLHIG